jgi:hypothetical protein
MLLRRSRSITAIPPLGTGEKFLHLWVGLSFTPNHQHDYIQIQIIFAVSARRRPWSARGRRRQAETRLLESEWEEEALSVSEYRSDSLLSAWTVLMTRCKKKLMPVTMPGSA